MFLCFVRKVGTQEVLCCAAMGKDMVHPPCQSLDGAVLLGEGIVVDVLSFCAILLVCNGQSGTCSLLELV